MAWALRLADRAARRGEVPVGAVVVGNGRILGLGHNRCKRDRDPTAHAEMVAMRRAFRRGAPRLPGAVLYCTLEPCIMCTGAAPHARLAAIVFAARDPKFGGCVSLYSLADDPRLNHRALVCGGLGEARSAELLRAFFRQRRRSVGGDR
jgi:tRNA(adenine34) deaminase